MRKRGVARRWGAGAGGRGGREEVGEKIREAIGRVFVRVKIRVR